MNQYSEEFKCSIIQKSLLPGGPSLVQLAKENGVILTTVYGWKSKYANHCSMSNLKKWTAEKKFQALNETSSLSENELGEYLRKNGLHSKDLQGWKKDFISSFKDVGRPKLDPEVSKLKSKEKELKKDLRRKEKALAEMSARIILLKKTQLFFQEIEDDE